jgi:TatD DNase family protein
VKFIDSHSHWTDKRFAMQGEGPAEQSERYAGVLKKCLEKSIDFFLLGGVDPEDWHRQIELKKQFPENFGLCFGLHPYFVADHGFEECEFSLDELAELLPGAMALGETGLDFRPHIMKDSQTRQIEFFENQIELAKAFQKPMVLHIVQAHEKARQIFHLWDPPERGGLVHAFNGSYETAKPYIDDGFLISVGGAVTFEKNKKLHDCVKKIPMEYLLLETDSPDQAPEGWQGLNNPTSLYLVAEAVGLIRNISAFDVLEISSGNFKRLFRI